MRINGSKPGKLSLTFPVGLRWPQRRVVDDREYEAVYQTRGIVVCTFQNWNSSVRLRSRNHMIHMIVLSVGFALYQPLMLEGISGRFARFIGTR